MSEIPPKQTVTAANAVKLEKQEGLPHFEEPQAAMPFTSESGLVLAKEPQGDAFAVLKAFQQYMESERQRSRRRTIILASVMGVLVLFMGLAFMMMFFMQQNQNSQLLIAAINNKQPVQPAQIVEQRPVEAVDTAKIVADAVAEASRAKEAEFAEKLEAITTSIKTLEEENKALKTAKKTPPPVAPIKPKEENVVAKVPETIPPTEEVELEVPTFAAPPAPNGFERSTMGIKVPSQRSPIAWSVYLPVR